MYSRVLADIGFRVSYFCVDSDTSRLRDELRGLSQRLSIAPLAWNLPSRIAWRTMRTLSPALDPGLGEFDHFWIRLYFRRWQEGLLDAPVFIPWVAPPLRQSSS
jgi:hypothetical protein